MRRALTAAALALCFAAASHEGAAAQERTKISPQTGEASAAEAVGSLVSLLKKARGYTIPRTQIKQRLSRVRAEGCVLRYNVVTESESPAYQSWDRPQVSDSSNIQTEREFTVNLSDLDAARVSVRVENQLKRESGGSVVFRTLDGKEAIREEGLVRSRLGARPTTRWSKAGAFSVGNDGSIDAVAAALKRAVEVCGGAGVRRDGSPEE